MGDGEEDGGEGSRAGAKYANASAIKRAAGTPSIGSPFGAKAKVARGLEQWAKAKSARGLEQ